MKRPKKRKPIKALRPPLYGIWMPEAACNAAEARLKRGEWVTPGMLATTCDNHIGTVAVWRSKGGARREIDEWNRLNPRVACINQVTGAEYGHYIRLYCRLGDLGRRPVDGRRKRTSAGWLRSRERTRGPRAWTPCAGPGSSTSCAMPKRG
jgi:hypothetical protein